ncbi:MAG TPA: phosphodiester glycosidase family protein [bacterium]|nr:phosphodiester glycosidase family protein [bacterium]
MLNKLGCEEAMNLDGGGSTTMFIRDRLVNRPSDSGLERPISDALVIVSADN